MRTPETRDAIDAAGKSGTRAKLNLAGYYALAVEIGNPDGKSPLRIQVEQWVPPSALQTVPRRVDSRLRGVRLPLSRRTVEWYQDVDAIDAWQNEGGA